MTHEHSREGLEQLLSLFGRVINEWSRRAKLDEAKIHTLATAFLKERQADLLVAEIEQGAAIDAEANAVKDQRKNFYFRIIVSRFAHFLKDGSFPRAWVRRFDGVLQQVLGADRFEVYNQLCQFIAKDYHPDKMEDFYGHPICRELLFETLTSMARVFVEDYDEEKKWFIGRLNNPSAANDEHDGIAPNFEGKHFCLMMEALYKETATITETEAEDLCKSQGKDSLEIMAQFGERLTKDPDRSAG